MCCVTGIFDGASAPQLERRRMTEPLIRVRGLCKSYGENEVIRDIDVDISRGDVISIIGGSGCGKSTFIRCLNFLDPPTSGEVYFDGKKVMDDPKSLRLLRRKMGMVFQSFNLFSNMTVVENVMLGQVDLMDKTRQQAYDRAMELLGTVGLTHRALAYPDELSGGQKQRAAIARTLALDPEVILFDEPTSALDPTMVGEVLVVMKSLADAGATMLIVTHEMNFARNVSNRVFYLDEKGIYEDGTPEQIFEHPERPKTRDFIFHVKTFSTDIHRSSLDLIGLQGSAATFLRRRLLPDAVVMRVLLVMEEAIYQCVFANECVDTAHFSLRCSEKTREIELVFRDPAGAAEFPLAQMEELSRRVINGYATEAKTEAGCLTIRMAATVTEASRAQ